jgi:hypothetical protein
MPLSKSKIEELNGDIKTQWNNFSKGIITYKQYESERARLIRDYYMKYYEDEGHCMLEYERDSEPQGLLGIAIRMLRKLF